MEKFEPIVRYLQPLRPFLSLFVFLLVISPLIWALSVFHGLDTEQAMTYFLPGLFVCFGYYVASNSPIKSKK